ncbi:Biotin--protein ligase [hydrothermal vent metagenome]|uniref:Biotin--protein ligase n=1 Tax=hydrothermal vent metagenome TaxID=652676 RepID=A0A3B0ZJZ1_9ZZZZ
MVFSGYRCVIIIINDRIARLWFLIIFDMHDVALYILKQLSVDRFCSGNQLARELGLTRTAVWKSVHMLRAYGVDIYSLSGKGYRLGSDVELLDKDRIFDGLKEADLISNVKVLSSVGSTNHYLQRLASEGEPSGSVVFSEFQSEGRGRRGRRWTSPFAKNLYCSVLWRYSDTQYGISGLSLAIGIAVVTALEQMGISGVGLKWPNDLLCDGRKVAGILLEMSGDPNGAGYVVIGIGINVDMKGVSETGLITQPWADLVTLNDGSPLSRNGLAILLLQSINSILLKYQQSGLSQLIQRWNALDVMFGREVVLLGANEPLCGIAQGIDDSGALLLLNNDKICRIHSGEVSLRLAGNSGDLCS